MVFDVLALALFLGIRWYARHHSEPEPLPPVLPFEDLPPVTAELAPPRGRRLTHYVEGGLVEIDQWLHHRDEPAVTRPPADEV